MSHSTTTNQHHYMNSSTTSVIFDRQTSITIDSSLNSRTTKRFIHISTNNNSLGQIDKDNLLIKYQLKNLIVSSIKMVVQAMNLNL